ncbi:hypothetical protein D3C76_1240310 [compost metagenome]
MLDIQGNRPFAYKREQRLINLMAEMRLAIGQDIAFLPQVISQHVRRHFSVEGQIFCGCWLADSETGHQVFAADLTGKQGEKLNVKQSFALDVSLLVHVGTAWFA